MSKICYPLFLLSASVLFLNGTCEDECPHELGPFGYVLHAEVTLTPLQETYRVGDTIDVIFRLPEEILNQGTSSFVKLSNVDIDVRSSMTRIDQISSIADDTPDVFHNFQLISYRNRVGNVELERITDLYSEAFAEPAKETSGDYIFSYSLITKTPGLYIFRFASINFGDEPGLPENIVEIENECKTSKLLYTVLNGATDANLDLLCESSAEDYCVTDEPRRSLNYEDYRRSATHVFRVVE